MTPTLVVGSLGLFPLQVPMLAFFGWLIQRFFANALPFPNLSQSWSSRAPSPIVALVLGSSSLFQHLKPCWQQLHLFSVLHGRLYFRTSLVQLIYVDNHRSCVPLKCIWINGRPKHFLDFDPPILCDFHLFFSMPKEKLHSPKPFFCPSICCLDYLNSNDNVPSDALVYDKNCTSFQFECCLVFFIISSMLLTNFGTPLHRS
jgi:hypothetical protein